MWTYPRVDMSTGNSLVSNWKLPMAMWRKEVGNDGDRDSVALLREERKEEETSESHTSGAPTGNTTK